MEDWEERLKEAALFPNFTAGYSCQWVLAKDDSWRVQRCGRVSAVAEGGEGATRRVGVCIWGWERGVGVVKPATMSNPLYQENAAKFLHSKLSNMSQISTLHNVDSGTLGCPKGSLLPNNKA